MIYTVTEVQESARGTRVRLWSHRGETLTPLTRNAYLSVFFEMASRGDIEFEVGQRFQLLPVEGAQVEEAL